MNVTLIHLLIIVGLQVSFATPANGASDYCAFEIKVSSPAGTPLAGVPVAMIQRDNKEFGQEVRTDPNGRASLVMLRCSRSPSSSGSTYAELSPSKGSSLLGPSQSTFFHLRTKGLQSLPRSHFMHDSSQTAR